MSVRLVLQDAYLRSGYLLEELIRAASDAEGGGASFAWATAAGARAFLEDRATRPLLSDGSFHLVVGVDQVTDSKAVEFLIEQQEKWKGLTVKAFVHGETRLFHPKMSWFCNGERATFIVGSGNLTVAGLRNNWESFIVHEVPMVSAAETIRELDDWVEGNSRFLLPIGSPEVAEAVRKNTVANPKRFRSRRPSGSLGNSNDVLIAQISKNGDRLSQANFHKDVYEDFFGAKLGSQSRMLLFAVDPSGGIGEPEIRPSVAVASRNYRFELNGFKGVLYPDPEKEGRPILVIRRPSPGVFLYSLEMPGTGSYRKFNELVIDQPVKRSGEMHNLMTSVSEVMDTVPNYHLWHVELPIY